MESGATARKRRSGLPETLSNVWPPCSIRERASKSRTKWTTWSAMLLSSRRTALSRPPKSCAGTCSRRIEMERILTYGDAIHEATDLEMDRDPSVVAFGIGVDDHRAFYGTLKGLADKYGDARIFGTPLAEDSMTGLAIGAALGGLRPIQIHERMDFVLLAMNQLVNIAAKSRYMYGGAVF